MDVYNGRYGLYRPVYDRHAYTRLTIAQVENPHAFFRGETPKGFDLPGPTGGQGPLPRQELSPRLVAEIAKSVTRDGAEPAKRANAVRPTSSRSR